MGAKARVGLNRTERPDEEYSGYTERGEHRDAKR